MLISKFKKTAISAAAVVAIVSTSVVSALAADPSYTTSGYVQFVSSTDPTAPVDPTDPGTIAKPENPGGETVTPGTGGPLSIDFASTLDFGLNKISTADQIYYANPQVVGVTDAEGNVTTKNVPNYVQVTDNRGSNAGWTLKVKQNGQLANATALNSTLIGARISLKNGTAVSSMTGVVTRPTTASSITLNPDGVESVVMSSVKDSGAGTWVDAFGTIKTVDGAEKNTDITLSVPGSTPKDAVKYSTTLTWMLSDVVTN